VCDTAFIYLSVFQPLAYRPVTPNRTQSLGHYPPITQEQHFSHKCPFISVARPSTREQMQTIVILTLI